MHATRKAPWPFRVLIEEASGRRLPRPSSFPLRRQALCEYRGGHWVDPHIALQDNYTDLQSAVSRHADGLGGGDLTPRSLRRRPYAEELQSRAMSYMTCDFFSSRPFGSNMA